MTQRIVVVDDAAVNRRVFAVLLEDLSDVSVSTFGGSEEALAVAPSLDPSLFIVDYRMPPPDGMELLTRLRADPRTRDTPVVMVTAADEREVCYAALERGASDFLVRPIDPREFQRRVQNLLALEAARREAVDRLSKEMAAARLQSKRLTLIWSAAHQAAGDDETYLTQLLDEAGTAIAEGRTYFGCIVRLDDEEFVVHVSGSGMGDPYRAGYRFRCARLEELLAAAGGSFEALLYAPFRCGATTYYVFFGSQRAAEAPFTRFDVSFVETIAAMCAARLDQRAQFARLRYQTEHDALTGLWNRATFRARGFAALREDANASLFVLNLDNFRHANDTLGHQTGDALLVEVGARLTAVANERETVARLGGDSFGVLARGCGLRRDAEEIARRFLDAFRYPFGTGDRENRERVSLGCSIGIAVSPADADGFEQLLARSDAACYAAKDAGRGRWAFFNANVESSFASIRVLQADLGAALARNEFVMHYQPHVEIRSGRITGAEALIRWQHPTRGLLLPCEFIPFAEQHGLAGAIGAWVMHETARASREWRRQDPRFRVWFNLSAAELRDETLVARLRELGDLHGLGVEVTESVAMENVTQTLRVMEALRNAGVHIALDDFGTGYSSLAHLKRLPLNVVKIDRAFVTGLPRDRFDGAIVDAVISIAHSYGFETLAEGVEEHEQARYLDAAGCTFGQGFLWSPGVPAGTFDAMRGASS